jgi:hypothetical protein
MWYYKALLLDGKGLSNERPSLQDDCIFFDSTTPVTMQYPKFRKTTPAMQLQRHEIPESLPVE